MDARTVEEVLDAIGKSGVLQAGADLVRTQTSPPPAPAADPVLAAKKPVDSVLDMLSSTHPAVLLGGGLAALWLLGKATRLAALVGLGAYLYYKVK